MEQETKRTVQIKLRTTPEQADEIEKLFLAFRIGLNFCLDEIEKAYQKTAARYIRINEKDVKDTCAGCGKTKVLTFKKDGNLYCSSCVMKEYSEYTIRTAVVGTRERKVERDLKDAVNLNLGVEIQKAKPKKPDEKVEYNPEDVVHLDNQTHFHMIFSQAYANWKSFNAWRQKREFERDRLKKELADMENRKETRTAVIAAKLVLDNARKNLDNDRKTTPRRATAMASRDVYNIFPNTSQKDISRTVNKLRRLNSLSRPLKLPVYHDVHAVQMHNNFVKFDESKLHVSLFYKKNNRQVMDFYRNKYLDQFLGSMEEDNAVYTNLIKRIDGKRVEYYLMYPITVKNNIPVVYDLTDVFTICFSPDRILLHCMYSGHNGTAPGTNEKWWKLGWIVDKKTHFTDKRRELQEHNTRNSLRRIKKMGNREQRVTRTFNHQLSHNIVEYITNRSNNPLIVMWDIGTGITADYGRVLNSVKSIWPVVQQQEFIKHKAFLRCVPVKMFPYRDGNDLLCSYCGRPFLKKDEFGKNTKENIKTITAMLRGVKNIKCESCRHELNLLINQARNLSKLPLKEEKKEELP